LNQSRTARYGIMMELLKEKIISSKE